MHSLATALERRDFHLLESLLADDILFYSPVTPDHTYQGQHIALTILTGATELLQDLHYIHEITGEGEVVLRFTAHVAEHALEGCHFLTLNSQNKIQEMTTMIRPLPAAIAFNAGMEAFRLRSTGDQTADS